MLHVYSSFPTLIARRLCNELTGILYLAITQVKCSRNRKTKSVTCDQIVKYTDKHQ